MGEATSNKILERKAANGRDTHLARAMTVQKAMRLTLAKVAEDRLDLAMAMLSVALKDVENEDLPELLQADQLLILLENNRGQIGLAMLDQSLVGSLVQQQTMGQVQETSSEERQPTRTDASLAAPLLDEFFERLENLLEKPSDQKTFQKYRFGDMAEDTRLALMALEAYEYKCFTITVDIARGVRQGVITLLLPSPGQEEPEQFPEDDVTQEDDVEKPDMTKTVLQLEADLKIVLCKLRVSLGDMQQMKPGMVIALPQNAFPDVSVVDVEGQTIAKGLIGQVDGQRAVKFEHEQPELNQPKRRASDRGELDLPDVTGIDRRDGGDGLGGLPAEPDLQLPAPPDAFDPPALPALDEMPGAPLPDLDLPDAPAVDVELPDLDGASDIDALPELDDLPNLADLPDLGDLPDLKMA